ncbi:MAG: hypothetical protein E4H20_11165 [Spirochaetales bacterium]|nr:MAG: hypothetical protein E4H20_11165 [Spirochaetales bacterium]
MELVASIMFTPYIGYDLAYDPSGISIAGSLKGELLRNGDITSAFLVRGAWASFVDEASSGWPPSWDGPARFPGTGAGLILEYAPGPGRLFASAEMNASTFYPGWGDATEPAWDVPGFFAWAYLRAGAESLVDLGPAGQLSASASAAARTWPVGGPIGFMAPLSVAAELAWYAPDSTFVVHGYAAGEWRAFQSWYFAGGLGLSLVY